MHYSIIMYTFVFDCYNIIILGQNKAKYVLYKILGSSLWWLLEKSVTTYHARMLVTYTPKAGFLFYHNSEKCPVLFGYLWDCCNFAVSNIFKGRRLSAYSRHFLCLYIIATKILRLLPPCGEVNALPTAFEVCSTTGKDSRFSVYNAKNVE